MLSTIRYLMLLQCCRLYDACEEGMPTKVPAAATFVGVFRFELQDLFCARGWDTHERACWPGLRMDFLPSQGYSLPLNCSHNQGFVWFFCLRHLFPRYFFPLNCLTGQGFVWFSFWAVDYILHAKKECGTPGQQLPPKPLAEVSFGGNPG